jgi:regulator of protease activity HflC (stomatin/prohibitin superfamily)
MFPKLIAVLIATIVISQFEQTRGFTIPFFILGVAIIFVIEGVRVVPQQSAWIVERMGKFHAILQPGMNVIVPFVDRIAYTHSLKEVPLDVPEQVCISRDNTQLSVDGVIYFQVTDPRLASYGSSNYIAAITQLAQTALRSEIGKMELDHVQSNRNELTQSIREHVRAMVDDWGIEVTRTEILDVALDDATRHAMMQQLNAERARRAQVMEA